MPDFRRRKQFTTREPQLKVDPGLPAGTYVFELQVRDQNGNLSNRDRVKVRIVDTRIPVTPVDRGDLRIDRPVVFDPDIFRPGDF